MGGENQIDSSAGNRDPGSSPRGRGKPGELARRVGDAGLIPAWAGKTADDWSKLSVMAGSSPRGRGKRWSVVTFRNFPGLIPAWAGKTPRRRATRCRCPAHPRVGGENLSAWLQMVSGLGSSPRGRGKPVAGGAKFNSAGLIPAWAGKTHSGAACRGTRAAHPRVGGENAGQPCRSLTIRGSSPRGRGKRDTVGDQVAADRLIPAWAGKTFRRAHIHPGPEAHPRVGGENSTGVARGGRPRWLIPAWAGKTPFPTSQ